MKKNGFTLIELLAVILILGIIALIAIPTVNKIIEESRRGAFQSTLENINKIVEQTCTSEQINDLPINTHYVITNGKVTPALDLKGDLPDGDIYVDNNCNVTYTLSDNTFVGTKDDPKQKPIIEKCNGKCIKYSEALLNGATPKLDSGMIPITIENDGTVKKANLYESWYNYQNKQWANTILVTDASRESIKNARAGSTINSNDILAYLVWVPRYKYKIPTVTDLNNPPSINIVFESKTTPKSTGNAITEYYSHPAFTFDGVEVDGIWVGKFETTVANISGVTEATTNTCFTEQSEANCNNSNIIPTVLPNKGSLRYQTVSNQFATAQKFKNYGVSGDAHMMKNSEWGAMAYFSHSIYGINKEVQKNNSSSYVTGYGSGTAYGNDNSNHPQSTTGNISGIFDTSGGSWERVMGNFNKTIANSGFMAMPENKYYDIYTTSDYETECNSGKCLGHSTIETKNWYQDYYYSVNSSFPWVARGGSCNGTTDAGLFSADGNVGLASGNNSFRLAFLVGA